jgi:Dolichyl-phosphate-mannose-protein mannosyltransferase
MTSPEANGEAPGHTPGARSGVPVKWLLGSAAVAICLFNSLDWLRRGETLLTRWLWIASIVTFLGSLVTLPLHREPVSERANALPRAVAVALLGAIVAVAFWLRFVDLATVPLDVHGDFTSMGLGAREILEGRVRALFGSGWADLPWASYLQPALTMKIFGDSLFGMNMEAVIAGTVTVIGIYVLAVRLFDDRTLALIAAGVSAIGYTDIHFSRVSAYIDPVPWVVFGLLLLFDGLKSGRPLRFGISGVLLAVGFEMYYSGRLAVVVIVMFLVYLEIFHTRLLLGRWKGLLVLLAAAILTTGPMLLFHLRHLHSFMDRTRQVYALAPNNIAHLLNKYSTTSPARMMVEQSWRSLLTFNYTGDSSTQFGFGHPMVNPALAPLLLLGLAVGIRRFRQAGFALLVIWLASAVVLGSIFTIDAPFWPRLVIVLPATAILIAIGFEQALRAGFSLFKMRPSPGRILLPALAVLAAVGHQNWQWYYHGSESTYVSPMAWVGRLIESSPPDTGFCMLRGPLDLGDRVPQFLGKGHEMITVAPEQVAEYKQRCVAEGHVWIIYRPDHDELLASLNREWPGARQERHDYPSGEPGPIFWYPPSGGGSNAPPAGQ